MITKKWILGFVLAISAKALASGSGSCVGAASPENFAAALTAAYNGQDWEKMACIYHADSILADGKSESILTANKIAEAYRNWYAAGFRVKWQVNKVDMLDKGVRAGVLGTYRVYMKDDLKTVVDAGPYILQTVYTEGEGWKILLDAYMTDTRLMKKPKK